MIKVKILSRTPVWNWLRYFPDQTRTEQGGCRFIFDQESADYDWAVVYEDLPRTKDKKSSVNQEDLSCPQQNTLLVTSEPPSIKLYDIEYTRQFGHVLTSHGEQDLPHPKRIYSQPALRWFVGDPDRDWQFLSPPPQNKNKMISTVCSSKKQKHTLHNQRYALTMALQPDLPEMDVFGRGIQFVESKARMMLDYKYHLAIENYNGRHHWTEKLSDCFATSCLPFYSGCTNLEDYFPDESYILIDLFDRDKTLAIMQKAISDDEYTKRYSAIMEARRLVMEDYSFFAVISKIINENHASENKSGQNALLSRHAIRKKHPVMSISRAIKKELSQYGFFKP